MVQYSAGPLYDGKVDVALIHGQILTREPLNLELVRSIMFVAYPGVCLREGGSLTDLFEQLLNLSGNFLVICTFRTAEFIRQDVASIEWQWLGDNVQGCRGFIDQLASIRRA